MTDEPFHLQRFVSAQDAGGTYRAALAELQRGRKSTHWMWFVLPQIAGLGSSPTAVRFAIRSLEEATAYLAHPVLGPRLRETTEAVLRSPAAGAEALLGAVDARKLQSSMTLFAHADPADAAFPAVLARFFDGQEDAATVARL